MTEEDVEIRTRKSDTSLMEDTICDSGELSLGSLEGSRTFKILKKKGLVEKEW
jgi:hypothetical protein